jgi:hypothetical protein
LEHSIQFFSSPNGSEGSNISKVIEKNPSTDKVISDTSEDIRIDSVSSSRKPKIDIDLSE